MSKLKLKYRIGLVSAVTALAGVAGPQALAGEDGISKASLFTQRAKQDYALQMQECDTLKNSQPDAYEPCMEKARSTRDNLLSQVRGSEDAGQGSQGVGSNQSQQQFSRQEEKGPIDKMTSAVKETVAEVKQFFGSGQQGQGQQQGQGGQSMGQGQQAGGTQGQHPLQQGFESRQMQGQGSGQGFGQQGAQGQQFQGQQPQAQSGQGSFQGQQPQAQSGQGSFQGQQPQGQSGQGSFQAGNYGQQPQGQSGQGSFQGQQPQGQAGQQRTGGTNQQSQSAGTQGSQQGQQGGMGGSAGAEEEHMDPGEYYKTLANQQYGTLKQECETLKQDPSVWEQCQQHAKSVRDKILGMAEQG